VQTADFVLLLLSWCLWLLAVVWLMFFAELVPTKQGWLAGLEDTTVTLIVSGQFCGSLSRLAPNGEWPAWRKPWYLAWVVVLAIMAFCFLQGSAMVSAGLCGSLAAAMAWACPAGPAYPVKASTSFLGRGLVVLDGAAGILLAAHHAWKVQLHSPVETLMVSITAMPLFLVSLAMVCSASESSLLMCLPVVMLKMVGASLKSAIWLSDMVSTTMFSAVFLLHASLYLPLPLNDPESNPFHSSFRRASQRFARFLSQPVSGFGDEGG